MKKDEPVRANGSPRRGRTAELTFRSDLLLFGQLYVTNGLALSFNLAPRSLLFAQSALIGDSIQDPGCE